MQLRRPVDWLAILTFVLASFWLFGIGSVLALVVGRLSLRQTRVHPELRGRTVAWAGIAVAIFGVALGALWVGLLLTV
jgi:hypothetical protein